MSLSPSFFVDEVSKAQTVIFERYIRLLLKLTAELERGRLDFNVQWFMEDGVPAPHS